MGIWALIYDTVQTRPVFYQPGFIPSAYRDSTKWPVLTLQNQLKIKKKKDHFKLEKHIIGPPYEKILRKSSKLM